MNRIDIQNQCFPRKSLCCDFDHCRDDIRMRRTKEEEEKKPQKWSARIANLCRRMPYAWIKNVPFFVRCNKIHTFFFPLKNVHLRRKVWNLFGLLLYWCRWKDGFRDNFHIIPLGWNFEDFSNYSWISRRTTHIMIW